MAAMAHDMQSPLVRAANEVHLEAWALWSNVAGLAESCDRLHDAAMAGDLIETRNLLRGILADLEEITEDVAPMTRAALKNYDRALADTYRRSLTR